MLEKQTAGAWAKTCNWGFFFPNYEARQSGGRERDNPVGGFGTRIASAAGSFWVQVRGIRLGPPAQVLGEVRRGAPLRLLQLSTRLLRRHMWPWFKTTGTIWDRCTTHFYFSGEWDVHWGYGVLTHGHMLAMLKDRSQP